MKFTIITVTYQAADKVEQTLKSVLNQTYKDYEIIVKDGLSTDGTIEVERRVLNGVHNASLIVFSDCGIYDAMNQAVSYAKGEYILFMNAGDSFANENVLQHVSEWLCHNEADILYGSILEKKGALVVERHYGSKNSKLWHYSLGACLCHQSMFCKRDLFDERKFDLSFKVCADREWQMYFIAKNKIAKPLGFITSIVEAEGFSSNNIDVLEEETDCCIQKYCNNYLFVYRIIMKLKKNKYVRNLLVIVERKVSTKKRVM